VSDLLRRFRGALSARQRLGRHVWRMCLSMFIATLSFFFGQAQLFPEEVRATQVHLVPIFLVAGATAYWLVRVRFLNWSLRGARGSGTAGSPPESHGQAGSGGQTSASTREAPTPVGQPA
jgi:hypothetical protein